MSLDSINAPGGPPLLAEVGDLPIGEFLKQGLHETVAFIGSDDSLLPPESEPNQELVRAFSSPDLPALRVGAVIERLNRLYTEQASQTGDEAKALLASRVRAQGQIVVVSGDGVSQRKLGNAQRNQFADELEALAIDYGDLSGEALATLLAIKADIAQKLTEARELLALPPKKRLAGLPFGRPKRYALDDQSPEAVEQHRKIVQGAVKVKMAARWLYDAQVAPTRTLLSREEWESAVKLDDEEPTAKQRARLIVHGHAILAATEFAIRSDEEQSARDEALRAEQLEYQHSRELARLAKLAEPVSDQTPISPKRRRSHAEHTTGADQDFDATTTTPENIHEVKLRIVPQVDIQLPWLSEGQTVSLHNSTLVRFQGQDVLVLDAIGPSTGNGLRAIAEQSRAKVERPKQGTLNPYDSMRYHVAKLQAAGISPEADKSRYLERVHTESEKYAGFTLWHTTGKGPNVERGYYGFCKLGDIAAPDTALPPGIDDPDTKVVLVVAETDKKNQVKALKYLTTATHASLRGGGGAGSV